MIIVQTPEQKQARKFFDTFEDVNPDEELTDKLNVYAMKRKLLALKYGDKK